MCGGILCTFFLQYTITDLTIESSAIRQTKKTIAGRIIWWQNQNMRYLTAITSRSKHDFATMLLPIWLLDSATFSLTIELLI